MSQEAEEFVRRAGRVLPPLITPFNDDATVDHGGLAANVTSLFDHGITGMVPLGSNSEAVHLSEHEKLVVIETVRTAAPTGYILAGTGQQSTRETIRLSNLAADLGADAVLIITPSFYAGAGVDLQQQERHFLAVADAVTVPVWIYNVAKFTGVDLPPAVMARILRHPNVAGVKDSSGKIDVLAPLVGPDVEGVPLVGTASALLPGFRIGVPGGIMALANAYPRELLALHSAHQQGQVETAQEIQKTLTRMNQAVTADFGVPGLKYVCTRRNYVGGHVRAPLADVDQEVAHQLDTLMEQTDRDLEGLGFKDDDGEVSLPSGARDDVPAARTHMPPP